MAPPVRVTSLDPQGWVTIEFSPEGLRALGNFLNAFDAEDIRNAGLERGENACIDKLWDATSIALDLTQPDWSDV